MFVLFYILNKMTYSMLDLIFTGSKCHMLLFKSNLKHRHLGPGFIYLKKKKIGSIECMFNLRAPWHVLLLF
jgi:hypothetical protein